jgi:hypothetical protein
MVDVALTLVAAAGFLALLAHRDPPDARWRQPGRPCAGARAGVYVVAALGTPPGCCPACPGRWTSCSQALLAAAFSIIPLLMLRFADEFVRSRAWSARRGGRLGADGGRDGAVQPRRPPGRGPRASCWTLFVLLWAVSHGVAVIWLLRGSRRVAAVVARRRAQLMAIAVGGLGAVLPVGVVSGRWSTLIRWARASCSSP